MRVIGITGGVGAGKSTVLALLQDLCDCTIIMADDVAKEMMEIDGALSADAVRLFGTKAYTDTGELDRSYIAGRIYADNELLAQWNGLVHPAVNEEIRRRIEIAKKKGFAFAFIEAALLIENHYETICDELWYVYAPFAVRAERLRKSRGYSDDKIRAIEASQLSEEEFRKHCQDVISTDALLEEVRRALEIKLEEYR